MEFWLRTLTSLLFGAVLVSIFYLGGVTLLVALLLGTAIVYREFSDLARHAGYRPAMIVGMAMALALVLQAFFKLGLPLAVIGLGFVTTVIWGYWVNTLSESLLADWSCTFTGALYSGGLLLHGILLRELPNGLAWAAIALLGTWSCDTGAYLVGKVFGRHRFAPRVSPNKTWEGAVGGFLLSCTVVLLTAWVFEISLTQAVGLGVLVPLAVISGDLTESLLKRSAGVKDAGKLIPGHGGLLDRIDGFIFVLPTVYYYVMLVSGG